MKFELLRGHYWIGFGIDFYYDRTDKSLVCVDFLIWSLWISRK